ncbi:Hypothetical protein Mbur_0412 [Methanococcoides burtonii DSM 6242]|uniref:Uncharacterized protein n=1 Tax=Methanococcoides burtonii (strain DSM 6242 / NBRC 107633 / OCM 468 / ACE-M) TaxID=259564 RepID=Q12YS6_METBU|nr:Hypothetical protein Mbur_0412 [Methanococcoides burtonii DSM 6242]
MKIGVHDAAIVCSFLIPMPLILLLYSAICIPCLYLASLAYLILAASCIQILFNDPVAKGNKLKDRMIMTLTISSFVGIFTEIALVF